MVEYYVQWPCSSNLRHLRRLLRATWFRILAGARGRWWRIFGGKFFEKRGRRRGAPEIQKKRPVWQRFFFLFRSPCTCAYTMPIPGFLLRVLCVHVHVPTAATKWPPPNGHVKTARTRVPAGISGAKTVVVVVDPRIRFEPRTDQKIK